METEDQYIIKFMEFDAVSELLVKYLTSGLSEEKIALNQWLDKGSNVEILKRFEKNEEILNKLRRLSEIKRDNERYITRRRDIIRSLSRSELNWWQVNKSRLLIAASIIVLVGSASLWYWLVADHKNPPETVNAGGLLGDRAPGKDGAILTLSNGQQIVLDTVANGPLTSQGTTEVLKRDDQVIYGALTADHETSTGTAVYNTLSTPRGRQYQLLLPDGSHIWLNAASSVKFPTQFKDDNRIIELNGEAYLEVAKDSRRPFKILAENVVIAVIGTHFNVNCYKEEVAIKTTLIEGKVKIISETSEALISSGEQAQIYGNTVKVVDNFDVDEAIA